LAGLALERAPLDWDGYLILSLAQFRPEKDHVLQLHALARLFHVAPQHRQEGPRRVRLILAGGCRDESDYHRVASLRSLCAEIGLRDSAAAPEKELSEWDVTFRTNVSLTEMRQLLSQAVIGLHTMREEHFGINVVEFMAAGAIAVAHNSGGPKMDIVIPWDGHQTGFLAEDEATYADAFKKVLELTSEARIDMARKARESVKSRFAQEAFEDAFANNMIAPLRVGSL